MPDLLHALAGIAGLIALAWLLSENRRAVPWRAIVVGLGLQVLLGAVFLRFSLVKTVFLKINDALLVLERAMRVGGVVGLSTAANVFVGMVEAPLLVRPYLGRVSRGELFAIMVGGMASIAGTVLFLYGSILRPTLPDAVAHLLIASILSAPAALVVAFVMVPPQGAATGARLELKSEATGSMDAVTRGTLEGA